MTDVNEVIAICIELQTSNVYGDNVKRVLKNTQKELMNMTNNKSNTRNTVLTFEHVLEGGNRKALKLVEFKNVFGRDKLPHNYLNAGFPYYYLNHVGGITYKEHQNLSSREVDIGDVLTIEQVNSMVKCMKLAGERLGNINREIKELEDSWCGGVTTIEI